MGRNKSSRHLAEVLHRQAQARQLGEHGARVRRLRAALARAPKFKAAGQAVGPTGSKPSTSSGWLRGLVSRVLLWILSRLSRMTRNVPALPSGARSALAHGLRLAFSRLLS